MKIVKKGDALFFRSNLLDQIPFLGHGISTRLGGVSEGPYQSLNLARALGDKDPNVFRNREILCSSVGAGYDRLTSSRQVLGSDVLIDDDRTAGNASQGSTAAKPTGDAHVTALPDTALMTLSADCTLVLLADPRRRVLGNAHASRKGTLGGIAAKTLAVMREKFGSDPADVLACIAPSIGPCCYKLGAEAAAQVRSAGGSEFLSDRAGRTHLDLWAYNRRQLESAGVPPSNIDTAKMCTRCVKEFFFSYRRDGERSGRFGALIWIKPS